MYIYIYLPPYVQQILHSRVIPHPKRLHEGESWDKAQRMSVNSQRRFTHEMPWNHREIAIESLVYSEHVVGSRLSRSSSFKLPIFVAWIIWNPYPPVIKHDLPENGLFISDFPIKTSIQFGAFPALVWWHQRVNIPFKIPFNQHFPMVFLWFFWGFHRKLLENMVILTPSLWRWRVDAWIRTSLPSTSHRFRWSLFGDFRGIFGGFWGVLIWI